MSGSSLALAFDVPAEPMVLVAARAVAARLTAIRRVDRGVLNSIMATAFGGSDAEGRWSVRDAHAALELGQVLWLRDNPRLDVASLPMVVEGLLEIAAGLVPNQTVRSEEQIELQQFATPPRLAWLAARAAELKQTDCVLEPSAGTGMSAVWAAKAGARLVLNEISPLRRECLGYIFPDATISGHDGELIDDLLDPALLPSVVLMNPPYSHGIERGHVAHHITAPVLGDGHHVDLAREGAETFGDLGLQGRVARRAQTVALEIRVLPSRHEPERDVPGDTQHADAPRSC